jgi:hypothetical protein
MILLTAAATARHPIKRSEGEDRGKEGKRALLQVPLGQLRPLSKETPLHYTCKLSIALNPALPLFMPNSHFVPFGIIILRPDNLLVQLKRKCKLFLSLSFSLSPSPPHSFFTGGCYICGCWAICGERGKEETKLNGIIAGGGSANSLLWWGPFLLLLSPFLSLEVALAS